MEAVQVACFWGKRPTKAPGCFGGELIFPRHKSGREAHAQGDGQDEPGAAGHLTGGHNVDARHEDVGEEEGGHAS